MAAIGDFDISQLKELQAKLNRLKNAGAFIDSCAEELAAVLLENVTGRTPVGQYTDGRTGGTLKKGWTGGTDSDVRAYARSLPVRRSGNTVSVEISNPVEYASYVEYGHKQQPGRYVPDLGKKLKGNWVPGKFMLTVSAAETQNMSRTLIENKIRKYLEEVLG